MGKSEQDKQKIKEMTRKGMEQDRMKLLARQPFISLILMHLEMIPISSGCTTACTDGERIFMNCRFYAKLDQDERLFVLAHEAWHCVLLHQVRYQGRNPHKFNIAADLEIHFILMDEQMKEPFVLPHDPNWKGLSAEEIYEKLNKSKKPSKRTELGHDSKNIHSNPRFSNLFETIDPGIVARVRDPWGNSLLLYAPIIDRDFSKEPLPRRLIELGCEQPCWNISGLSGYAIQKFGIETFTIPFRRKYCLTS